MPELTEIDAGLLAQWMKSALAAAIEGVSRGENPFGAGVYRADGSIISLEFNQVVSSGNPLAHAELRAITAACKSLSHADASGSWLVSTAEPCSMCLSAALIAGITQFAYGASHSLVAEVGYGGVGLSAVELTRHVVPAVTIEGNILANDCSALLYNHRKQKGTDHGPAPLH